MTMSRMLRVLLLAGLTLSTGARADGIGLLRQWLSGTHSGSAAFAQRVVDDRGRLAAPPSSGRFDFERPGRFHWQYAKPYAQDIVSDGRTIWTYDHDLNQVTVARQSQLLGSTPAALLAGTDVERLFTLADRPDADGLQWVQADPRSNQGTFVWVRLGLRNGADGPELVEMQLRDAFRRTSTIHFDALRRNPALSPRLFHFTPPPGAAVLQQPQA